MAISGNMTSIVAGGPNIGTGGAYALGPGDAQEPAFVGQATLAVDGSQTGTLNFIDGTNAIPFIPSGVRLSRVGGNETNNTIPVVSSTALNNISVAFNFSAATTAGKTVVILAELYK
jgi:hypothetical protein